MIAYITITSFSSGGEHYYGKLQVPFAKRESIDLEYILTESDCRNLNRRRTAGDFRYTPGDISTRFISRERLLETAIRYIQENHPEVSILLEDTFMECNIALWHKDGQEAIQTLEMLRIQHEEDIQHNAKTDDELYRGFLAWKTELKRIEEGD